MTRAEQDRLQQLIAILESSPTMRGYVAKELRRMVRYEDELIYEPAERGFIMDGRV